MRGIWTEENKFRAYLEVEILAAEAWSTLGVIPAEDVRLLREKATFNVDRIHEIEEITRHDVVAFTRTVSESLGEERKWVHYGLTSTDVVDTANGYLLKQANEILREDLPGGLMGGLRRAFAAARREVGRIADHIVHAAGREDRRDRAQVAPTDGDIGEAVQGDRALEQGSRPLVQLEPGDREIGAVAEQGERPGAAAQVEQAGVFADAGEGREQHGILSQLEKTVVLQKLQAVRQIFL